MRLLFHKYGFPLVVTEAVKVAVIGPIEEFTPLVGTLASEKFTLVVAIEMDPEVVARGGVAIKKFGLDIRCTGGGDQRRCPVLGGEEVVDPGARWHQTRPAYQRRDAVATLPVGVLLSPERRRSSIRPGKSFGAVVRGVDHDRVVANAELVEFPQELANLSIMLHHAIRIDAEPRPSLRFGLEMRPDVHAGRIEPDEERLAVVLRAIDEIKRRLEEFLVDRLHALFGERTGVLASLFAPGAKAWIIAWRVGRRGKAFQDAARTKLRSERRIFRVVWVFGFVLCVEVIEIAEELVEAVNRRQELVAVAEVVFAELPGRIALRLEQLGDCRVLGRQPLLR